MSESSIYTPDDFAGIIAYTNTFERAAGRNLATVQSISTVGDMCIPITSKTLHYGASDFEGARVDVHHGKNGYRLHILHYDWNVARLNHGAANWGYGFPKMSDEEHMLAVVNLLYSNGWDVNAPIVLDGTEKATYTFYIRPLIHLPGAKNITLRNHDPFDFALVVFPQAPYHGEKKNPGMAVLHVPEPRNLSAPWDKRADNYPNSMVWVARMEKFLKWLEEADPDIAMDGKKLQGHVKSGATAFLKENMKEVLFNNSKMEITEGSAENIAILRGNRFSTPPIGAGALPGFSMQKVELIAQEIGLAAVRETFCIDDLKNSKLAIMTGNAAGAVPISWVVECDWDNGNNSDYAPRGNVRITSIGDAIEGAKVYGEIKGHYDLILAGKSPLGKFGAYADEFVTDADVRDIRERTREMIEYRNRRIAEIAKEGPDWAEEKFGVVRKIDRLFGKAPDNFRTKLECGRQITYQKLLSIK